MLARGSTLPLLTRRATILLMVMRLDEFKQGCEAARAARRECASWTLAFAEKEFQREWYVTATAHTTPDGRAAHLEATVQTPSAYATAATPGEVIEQLVRMIREM
jgi:hypothetical protein